LTEGPINFHDSVGIFRPKLFFVPAHFEFAVGLEDFFAEFSQSPKCIGFRIFQPMGFGIDKRRFAMLDPEMNHFIDPRFGMRFVSRMSARNSQRFGRIEPMSRHEKTPSHGRYSAFFGAKP